MRSLPFFLSLLLGSTLATVARADNCGDLAMRFASGERFHMALGELDELKTCINLILREKISASSTEARGVTSPPVSAGATPSSLRPRPAPALQDAE